MHSDKLCDCDPAEKCLRYRYSLDELPEMLKKLRVRADAYNEWNTKVTDALNRPNGQKLGRSIYINNECYLYILL